MTAIPDADAAAAVVDVVAAAAAATAAAAAVVEFAWPLILPLSYFLEIFDEFPRPKWKRTNWAKTDLKTDALSIDRTKYGLMIRVHGGFGMDLL